MIPEKLSLEGFLSYKTYAELDLSQIKVACVSGANGAGKSTIFDAMTWALFGRARRNDDALINNKVDRCQIVFEFIYENNRYRVERTKSRGKGTILEFQIRTDDGLWKPLTESGVRLTEERIRETLRLDYDTFINASFFLQGKADMFATQTPAQRKEILSSILGLEVWEGYRDETAKRRRDAQRNLDFQQSILGEITKELGEEDIRVHDLAQKEALLASKVELRESNQALLDQARLLENQLKGDREKLALLNRQVEGFDDQFTTNMRLLNERQQESTENEKILAEEKDIQDLYNKYQYTREALRKVDSLSVKFNELLGKKTQLESFINQEKALLEQEQLNLTRESEEITEIEENNPVLDKKISEVENDLALLTAEIDKIASLEVNAKEIKDRQSELEAENNRLSKDMQILKKRMDELSEASGTTCPLCQQPLTGEHKDHVLADLQAEGKKLGDAYRENKILIAKSMEDIAQITNDIDQLNAMRSRQNQLAAEVAVLKQQKEETSRRFADWRANGKKRLSVLRDKLVNGNVAEDQQRTLQEIKAQIDELAYQPEQHELLRRQESDLQNAEAKYHKLEAARTAQTGLNREMAELKKRNDQLSSQIKELKSTISVLERSIEAQSEKVPNLPEMEEKIQLLRIEENTIRHDVGAARQLVTVLEAQRKRKMEIETEMQSIAREISRLKMLETAFGRDGIPALLIEQAIPQIESQANDILDKLTNGNMSVSFETERAYADKKRDDKKQTLDIMISDSAGRRAYELFSGGEAFRINFAIRLALSRMLAHRSGARLQTLVIDEGFGSQDAEGRQRLVEAINLVSGDFEKMLVITHLDELKDAFSSRIEVTKTREGSQVEVVP